LTFFSGFYSSFKKASFKKVIPSKSMNSIGVVSGII